MVNATLRYTTNIDGFFETVEESRIALTEKLALEYIYKVMDGLVYRNILKIENIVFIKTEGKTL
jgi:hypothetical protein